MMAESGQLVKPVHVHVNRVGRKFEAVGNDGVVDALAKQFGVAVKGSVNSIVSKPCQTLGDCASAKNRCSAAVGAIQKKQPLYYNTID
jgi:hypothetical protein